MQVVFYPQKLNQTFFAEDSSDLEVGQPDEENLLPAEHGPFFLCFLQHILFHLFKHIQQV
jgi:hypothetical protein